MKSFYLAAAMAMTAALTHAAEVGPGDDLRGAISALGPGDALELTSGNYDFSSAFRITATGTAAAPVVIRAQAGHKPVIRMNTGNHNVVEVISSRYLELRGLTFTGGSHGVRLMDSDFVTVADCEIYETGDVALSANSGGTYTGLQILRNHIHHTNGTGEGMYLGCNNDGCRVENSLIAGNYVHHTNRSSVEQGDGIELKEGSSGNVIRDNVIHDTKYPGILVYGAAGNGPANVIEGNVIWNSGDWGIQAAADAVIINNIVLDGGVSFQSHQSSVPANIEFLHNTVVHESGGLWVRNVAGPIRIGNNALYAAGGPAIRLISGDLGQVQMGGNVGIGGVSGGSSGFTTGGGLADDFVNGHGGVPPIDLYPSAGSALIDAGNSTFTVDRDFNGTPRSGTPDTGAYTYGTAGNPGWAIIAAMKGGATASIPNPPVIHTP